MKGNQKPRIDQYNNGDIWIAEKTIELLEHYGRELLPWQKLILRRWLAVDENGKWANPEAGLWVARQNGKSFLFEARIIGGMVFAGEALYFTAQSTKTTGEIKRRVMQFFYNAEKELSDMLTDEFDNRPRSLDYLELRNGGRCIFNTRTRTGGLGGTVDTLLLDEAAELTDAEQEALLPTLSAGVNQNHQVIYASMPPTSGSKGTVLVRVRNNVIDGKAPDICWQEWSVETLTDPHDEKAWYEANPSLGYFLMKSAIRNEAQTFAIDSFNKQRLGWIEGVESARLITNEEWDAVEDKKFTLQEDPTLAYAVKFSPDRSSVSLAVAVIRPDGKVHVEVIERKPMSQGISWLVRWLLERWQDCVKIVIDGQAGSQLLIEELYRTDKRLSKKMLAPNVKEVGTAYGSFIDAIKRKEITHFGQPLVRSVVNVTKERSIGRDGLIGFASMNPDLPTDPLDAMAFAHYAVIRFQNNKKKSGTGQKILI